MLGFVACTELLEGNGWGKAPPQETIQVLQSLPERAIIVLGPPLTEACSPRSSMGTIQGRRPWPCGSYRGLIEESNVMVVVADGGKDISDNLDTIEACLKRYAWAMGYVPTTAPKKLTAKDLPKKSLL